MALGSKRTLDYCNGIGEQSLNTQNEGNTRVWKRVETSKVVGSYVKI